MRKQSLTEGDERYEDAKGKKDRPEREHFRESSKRRYSERQEAEAARNEGRPAAPVPTRERGSSAAEDQQPDSELLPGPGNRKMSVRARKMVEASGAGSWRAGEHDNGTAKVEPAADRSASTNGLVEC